MLVLIPAVFIMAQSRGQTVQRLNLPVKESVACLWSHESFRKNPCNMIDNIIGKRDWSWHRKTLRQHKESFHGAAWHQTTNSSSRSTWSQLVPREVASVFAVDPNHGHPPYCPAEGPSCHLPPSAARTAGSLTRTRRDNATTKQVNSLL